MPEIDKEKLEVLIESISDQSFWDDLLERYPYGYPQRTRVLQWTAKERLCVFLADKFVWVLRKFFPTLEWAIEMEISFQRCEGGD